MPDLNRIVVPDWVWLVLQILLVVVVAWLALRFARGFVHRLFKALLDREVSEGTAQELSVIEIQRRMTTLDELGANVLQFFIVVIAGLMVLGVFHIDVGPAIAGLGIVGIAVGFGAQSLVKDYFNGALILIENQYGKGDVVRIAGVEGTVEDLTLRRTTLRDEEGNVHTVPNSAIIVASNLTRGWARINEELQVPTADLVDAASRTVDRVGREMAADPAWRGRLLEPPHVERIDALGPAGITLRIGARVAAEQRWSAVGELRRRLLDAFRQQGLPFVPSASAPTSASTPSMEPTEDTAASQAPAAALDTTPGNPPAPAGQAQAATSDTTAGNPPAAAGQDDLAQGGD